MAQMIKYKGQLYKRIDNGEAPLKIRVDGVVYERVDGWFSRTAKNMAHKIGEGASRAARKIYEVPGKAVSKLTGDEGYDFAKARKEAEKKAKEEADYVQKRLNKHPDVKSATCKVQSAKPSRLIGLDVRYTGRIVSNKPMTAKDFEQIIFTITFNKSVKADKQGFFEFTKLI